MPSSVGNSQSGIKRADIVSKCAAGADWNGAIYLIFARPLTAFTGQSLAGALPDCEGTLDVERICRLDSLTRATSESNARDGLSQVIKPRPVVAPLQGAAVGRGCPGKLDQHGRDSDVEHV
jgi:hypothetical protein